MRAGPALVAVAGAAMLAWSWRRWPDPLIDFGRELYVPWRLVEGEILYADLAYFNGPLSPYLNALWFRLFDVSLLVLALCNIALAALLAAVLWRLLHRTGDRLAATVGGLVFVVFFAFGQIDIIGNYNYVTPYSHEMTHGLLLGALAVLAAPRPARRGRRTAVVAGLLLGLVFLTKAEPFAAAAGAVAVGLVLAACASRRPARVAGDAAVLVLAAAVPFGVAVTLLATAMPLAEALRGALGPWTHLFDERLASLPFYRQGLGTLALGENLRDLARWTLLYAAVLGPAVAVSLWPRRGRGWRAAAVASAALPAVVVGSMPFAPGALVRPLPVLLPLLAAATLRQIVRSGRSDREAAACDDARALRLVWIVFSLLLLAKIFLNVRLIHYGFVLALPGTLVLATALVTWLPRWIDRRGGAGWVVRATFLVALAAVSVPLLVLVDGRFERRTVAVADGGDRFYAGRRGAAVERALHEIRLRLDPDETLVVLPEGVMVNYLARRVNPTGHLNFMPPELIMFGEAEMIEAFRRSPPDFVLLAHKDTGEYGFRFFGRDYGQALFAWVRERYRPVWRVGATPLRGAAFGLQLLERADRFEVPEADVAPPR